MKSVNLDELELVELTESEKVENNGGIWKDLALIAIAGIVADWADFKKGLAAGLAAN